MDPFPHRYAVAAGTAGDGDVFVEAERLEPILSAMPAEFGGPGNRWSPETLLVAAVADCFVLTFRGIAIKARLAWTSLTCIAVGTLDRVDHVTRFTELNLRARLQLPAGTDEVQARRLLEKAEQNCLVANSLNAAVHLEAEIDSARAIAIGHLAGS
jgi:peroxiredoxin-like protein